MIRSIGILIMIAGAFQQNPPAEAQRHQDVYAIYSAMMSYPPSLIYKNDDILATVLAIESVTTPAMLNTPCITPPPALADRWTEVLADFNARKDSPRTLERDLKILNPYVYLKPDELSNYVNPQKTPLAEALAETEVKDRKEVFTLSDVYFNKDRTLALSGVRVRCGTMCFSSQWRIYEKQSNGEWSQVRPQANCYQVA